MGEKPPRFGKLTTVKLIWPVCEAEEEKGGGGIGRQLSNLKSPSESVKKILLDVVGDYILTVAINNAK